MNVHRSVLKLYYHLVECDYISYITSNKILWIIKRFSVRVIATFFPHFVVRFCSLFFTLSLSLSLPFFLLISCYSSFAIFTIDKCLPNRTKSYTKLNERSNVFYVCVFARAYGIPPSYPFMYLCKSIC